MTIAFYIIAGFVLFAILWLANKAIQTAIAGEKIHPVFQRIFPVIELLLWFFYLIWALKGIFSQWHLFDILMYAVLLLIFIGVGWFILKDFFAGIVLKSEIPFQKNQHISLPNTSGKLKKLGYRSLEIEDDKGSIVKIPYSRLTNEAITCQKKPDGLKSYETIITIKKSRKSTDYPTLITNKIMLLPWSVPAKMPTVQILDDKNTTDKKYLVKYFAANPQHAEKIAQHIKDYLEKNI